MKNLKLNLWLIMLFILGVAFSGGANLNAQHLDFDDAANESFFVRDNTSDDLDVNGNWTFEAWVNIHNRPSGTFPVIMNRRYGITMYVQARTVGSGDYSIVFGRRSSSDVLIASINSNNAGAASLSFGDNVHIAATRDGTTARLFINGILVDSSTDADFVLSNSSQYLNFGARYFGSYQRHLDGEIDEIRVSDIARYTSNFTPANTLSSDGNTRLLLHLDEGTGTAIADASGNFSGITLNDGDAIPDWVAGSLLPIHLTTFHAQADNKTVQLNWQTLSETNNKGFYVQRSSDARNWEDIGFVAGTGDAHRTTDYSFTDKSPKNANYYRLKQVDFDGLSGFSDIEYVPFSNEKSVLVYPIPAQNVVYYSTDQAIPFEEVLVYDIQGNLMSDLKTGEGKVDISSLRSGVYFLQFRSGSEVVVQRFTKE